MIQIQSANDLASYALAGVAFRYAKSFLPLIRATADQEARAAAYGALCGYYARPFKKSNGFQKLSADAVVPVSFIDVHKGLVHDRDKLVVHTDADTTIKGVLVNTLEFVSDGQSIRVRNIYVCRPESFLAKVESLLDEVIVRAFATVTTSLNDGPISDFQFGPGTYQLNHMAKDGDWLVPVKTNHP